MVKGINEFPPSAGNYKSEYKNIHSPDTALHERRIHEAGVLAHGERQMLALESIKRSFLRVSTSLEKIVEYLEERGAAL